MWPMPHVPQLSPMGRKVCPWQRRPENQVLPSDVRVNLLPALGRELLMFKVVVLVASCPAASLIFPFTSVGFFVLVIGF